MDYKTIEDHENNLYLKKKDLEYKRVNASFILFRMNTDDVVPSPSATA